MSTETEDFLQHFGVKGMKWGIRRTVGSDGRIKRSAAMTLEPDSKDHTEATAIRARAKVGGTRVLSNTEMQTAINRMNLEQQFSRVSPVQVSKGKKVTSAVLKNAGGVTSNVARSLATQYATQYAKKAIDGAIKNSVK